MNKKHSLLDNNHRVQQSTSYIFTMVASRRRHLTDKETGKAMNNFQKNSLEPKGLRWIVSYVLLIRDKD